MTGVASGPARSATAGAAHLTIWGAVLLGALLRLRQYAHGRPLWIDEAMLAANILLRDFAGLARPLESDQAAPLLFLWAERAIVLAGGPDERVLRLLPFVAGLLLLVVFAQLARRLLPPGAAALAVLIVALSPLLSYYSNEVKSYGLGALLAAALALASLRLVEAPGSAGRWTLLGGLGLVAAIAMLAAPFLLAGTAGALWFAPAIREAPGGRRRLLGWSLGWAALFLAAYFLAYHASEGSAYMQRYWVPWFLDPALPDFGRKLAVLPLQNLLHWFVGDGGAIRYVITFLLLVPLVVGAVTVARRGSGWVVALFLLPLALALVASGLRAYPFAPRLLLFAAPGIAILIADGVAAMAGGLAAVHRAPWFALGALAVVALPALDAGREFAAPREREALAPLVDSLTGRIVPGATVYVYGRAVPAWVFYTTDWRAPDTARVRQRLRLVSSTGPAFRHAASRGQAVQGEGNEFQYAYRGWTELVGVPTGTGPDSLGVNAEVVDAGWAENEARRIMAAGGPEAWVVFSSHRDEVPGVLEAALAARGGERTLLLEQEGARLSRWRFR